MKQRADTRIRLVNNVRYFPSKVDGLRESRLNLWDISVIKQVRASGRVRAQFHVELLNAFNQPVFANPNTDPTNADFGKVTSQTQSCRATSSSRSNWSSEAADRTRRMSRRCGGHGAESRRSAWSPSSG